MSSLRPLRLCGIFLLLCSSAPCGENETRFALSLSNEAGYAAGMSVPGAASTNLSLLQSSLAWRRGQRWRFAASAAALAATQGDTTARVRIKETYFGFTAGDFDFTLGKKILKWSTGYAFTPAGVLDPPRNATDPTDRLNLNEGRELASVDYIRGRHAFTAAWASGGLLARHRPDMRETTAFRYNTLIAGFDASLIVARDRGRPTFTGANFTRVFGESIEIHGEFAHRRAAAVLLGGKYTLRSGVYAIFEYYSPSARDYPSPAPPAGAAAPDRRHYTFVSAGKARLRELPGWKEWGLSAAFIVNAGDRSRIAVFDAGRRFGDHFYAYARAQAPAGARWRSEYGMIPYSALVSAGVRFHI